MRQLGHLKIDKICKFVFSNRKWEERKLFELEKGKHSNQKKEKYSNQKRENIPLAEEQEQEDKNKRIRPRERAHGQKSKL